MKTQAECLPCLGRNAVDVAKRISSSPAMQEKIVKYACKLLSGCSLDMSPPEIAGEIIASANMLSHPEDKRIRDVYKEEKKKTALLAANLVKLLPELEEYDNEDFEKGVRLAISGNIIDFGVFSDPTREMALQAVKNAFTKPIDSEAVKALEKAVKEAKKILYILDNCGEANLDKVFLERFREKVTLVVRGNPVFNDMTKEDLADAGLSSYPFIEIPGTLPGLVIEKCDEKFKSFFHEADLIIAKGQGNFETMNEYKGKKISFLFLAKCPVVTKLLNVESLSLQVINHNF
ncbi:MAG: DUF89 family protein [Lentisphaeria bacterium]|nr:DUF89 family protein [Lentisphaeria bacterium]